jgi:hypothetical protein
MSISLGCCVGWWAKAYDMIMNDWMILLFLLAFCLMAGVLVTYVLLQANRET